MTRVALTQRTVVTAHGEIRDCLDQAWAPLLRSWGSWAFPVPTAVPDPDGFLDDLGPDAVILTGGNDLAAVPGARDATPGRDALESKVVAWCRRSGTPLVGVCRGMQLLAHSLGAQIAPVGGHAGRRHRVLVTDGPGDPDAATAHYVNSFHRYAVAGRRLPRVLRAFALDEDGNVEAFVHRERPEAGIMWHPERESDPDSWTVSVLAELLAGALR